MYRRLVLLGVFGGFWILTEYMKAIQQMYIFPSRHSDEVVLPIPDGP